MLRALAASMPERVNTGGRTTIVNTKEDLQRQRSRRDKVTDEFGAAYEEHRARKIEERRLEIEKERKRRLIIIVGAVVLSVILIVGRIIA
jgi:hypothetical protein